MILIELKSKLAKVLQSVSLTTGAKTKRKKNWACS